MIYLRKCRSSHSDIVVQVNGAKLSYDVGAKMSIPIFFRGTKMSIARFFNSELEILFTHHASYRTNIYKYMFVS